MTHYNLQVTALPDEFVQYCNLHNYSLSLKKKYIIAHILKLVQETDVDTLSRDIRINGAKVSKSSVYLILQWLTANGFVTKISNGHNEVSYRTCSSFAGYVC